MISWLNLIKIFWIEFKVKFGFAHPTALISFLSSSDWNTRWNAADSLCSYQDQELILPVFRALQEESNPHVRKRLMWVLEANKAWDELYSCLDSSEFDVRSNAANALSHSGESRFVAPLLDLMQKGDNQDSNYIMILKGLVNPSSVNLLFEYLSNATPAMKRGLLILLGASRNTQVFDYLVESLRSPDAQLREAAVLGFTYLKDPRAFEPLQEMLNDPSDDVRREIRAALHTLTTHFSPPTQ